MLKYNHFINSCKYQRRTLSFGCDLFLSFKYSISFCLKRSNHHLLDNHPPLELSYKYIEGSSGLTPLVICHGMLGSHQNWSMIGKKLNQETGRSIYMLDMRNHGSSPHSSKMTYYDMASDIELFINNHGFDKVVALGHSMGGRTVLALSLLCPSIVDELIVVDSSPISRTTEKGMADIETFLNAISKINLDYLTKQNLERIEIKKHLDEKLKENGIKSESKRQWVMMNLVHREIHEIKEYDWNFNFSVLQKSFRPNLTLLPQEILRNDLFSKKTLFIGSPISDYIPKNSHDEIKKYFPSAKFVYIDGAGHWVHADKPKEFIKIVAQFLNDK